ncbi:Rrf2 family transcriptional regulator [Rhizobium sp. CCGE 510]|uniref:Rrf2 family transcriptional regulator n=1 Tax=Rhizobium sp. CCGE 510 TaxID=1132836 RepID=UPI00027B90E1|nr:Rrf2 family transcriptional regulator [Rhizobium sp. CCGE 510]EJT05354.1 BadM/Rrf2 family transcriptional regulator [Rhizobium sp. CCGE 510]
MPTSTRFVVAVHTLAILAINEGRPVRSEDLAFSVNTNPTVIRSLLSGLADAGFTTAQLGAGGGALLAKKPSHIALLDVYRAVEDSELFSMHRSPPNSVCLVGRNIQNVLRPTLDKAQAALEAELAQVTVADIAADIAQRGDFRMPS